MHLGKHFSVGDTLTFCAQTFNPSTGAAADADSPPTYRVYEDETTTPLLTGSMALLDSTNTDGFYSETITLSGIAGFNTGSDYTIRMSATNGSTTGAAVHHFGIGNAPADVVAISGDSGAADNIEAMYDGTGLVGDNYPSYQSQLAGLTNVGSAVNTSASSYVLTTGTQTVGLYTSTAALDGNYHTHTDAAGAIELYYQFTLGAGIPASVTVDGYVNGANDSIGVYAYDWPSTTWIQIGTWAGKASTANEENSYPLYTTMVGTGADAGKVRVRFYAASGLTSATLAVDRIYCSFNRSNEGYANGSIWVDTTASNTNTVVGIDGTATNPVSTIAAANTLSTLTNINSFFFASGSSITLAASHNSQLFQGHGWDVALGGQDIDECHFFDAAVSGVGTAATEMEFHHCEIGTASLQKAHCYNCTFDGTVTMTLAGNYNFIDCHSGVAGAGSPTFTKTPGQAITASFRRWSGGITISGIEATDTISIDAISGGTVTLNGVSGNVQVRGMVTVVDNRTGTPTLGMTQVINQQQIAEALTLLTSDTPDVDSVVGILERIDQNTQ